MAVPNNRNLNLAIHPGAVPGMGETGNIWMSSFRLTISWAGGPYVSQKYRRLAPAMVLASITVLLTQGAVGVGGMRLESACKE